MTITISATATINAELTVSAKSAVELALGSALGMTIGTSMTLSADCPIPTPGCAIKAGRVEVREVIGRKARVEHEWALAGTWRSHSWPCHTCVIEGSLWTMTCPTAASIGEAFNGAFTCLSLTDYPCTMICEH